MTVDLSPSWKSGHATIREVEAQLPSIRVVMAGYEAAKNAGLEISHYTLLGDGHLAGKWELGVIGRLRPRTPLPHEGPGAVTFEAVIDPDKVHAVCQHWKRLCSFGDWHLVVRDVVNNKILVEV